MRTIKKSDVTYGQLEAALQKLGFDVSQGTNSLGFPSLRFQNTAAGAVILLRAGAPEEALNAADLLSGESTLEGRGVAGRETFHRLLHEAAPKDAQAA
jgi:hypothetical protein